MVMKQLRVERYTTSKKSEWDRFIGSSKNGTFLFYRDYMEYHADRFVDHSLLFFEDEKLIAVLPANLDGDVLVSHGGLTYGGVITDQKMRMEVMMQLFDILLDSLRQEGMRRLVYKTVPHIYHIVPAEEDLYALFVHNARLSRRDVSATIDMMEKIGLNRGKKASINQGKSLGLEVRRSYDFRTFMSILTDLLHQKYDAHPTHTTEELVLLADKFPENIKLFEIHLKGRMLAGVVIYESQNVAHMQYSASSEEGKTLDASVMLLNVLINEYYAGKKYFDFGISTEKEGRYLNRDLMTFKEHFGARAVAYDFYEIKIE
jgi:hypothetical protein